MGSTSHPIELHPDRGVFLDSGARSRRTSSWDRSGANRDCILVAPGDTVDLLAEEGSGCITHVYVVMGFHELTDYRDAILRCYWDGEPTPSVEVPLGDFFGIAHARVRPYHSHFTAVNPGDGCPTG